jgi:hypothetical protein
VSGIPPAEIGEMTNTFIEFRDSITKALVSKHSIPFCTAIYFVFCSVSGPAPLPTTHPASAPAPDALPPVTTGTAPEMSFARGIDISPSAGEPAIQDFENIKQQGYRFVIVAGWGGVNPNNHASVQLSRARSAGLLTAGYCYLNFASLSDGGLQVREALAAFSEEWAYLGFLAIDVETSAWNQLSAGLQTEPPDSIAQQIAVARISEALPLWHPKTIGGDDLNLPDLANPAYTFGGWTSRVGKQYVLDTILNSPPIQVDLNVFDLNAFSTSSPNHREGDGFRVVAVD